MKENASVITTESTLKMIGVGSGFSPMRYGHTSAYFEADGGTTLYLLDCPMSAFYFVTDKDKFDLSKYDNVYCLITHTHSDHIGGLSLLIQYMWFVLHERLTVVAPSSAVKRDIETLLSIEGNQMVWYSIQLFETYQMMKSISPFLKVIPTTHSPELRDKCFGYVLRLKGVIVIYTGDTVNFTAFQNFINMCTQINPKANFEVYIDCSVHYGQIHMEIEDILRNVWMKSNNVRVLLIHLDDFKGACEIVKESGRKNVFVLDVKEG